ncbi:MAG: type II secretion system protein GspL [Burkholderiaceae bacterium]|nr:type II secretion system protein GspL [Burkholderiaceae bacterium]
MAAQVLKRGQAVVWVPPRSVGERQFASAPVLLAMLPAAVSEQVGGAASAAGHPVTVFGSASNARYARMSLDALPPLRQVTLVFDARDVNLLRVAVPPLSPPRLQQALPNLVEDLLLQDAQSCAYALGPRESDTQQRPVAAIDRAWLEFVVGAFERRGIRVQAAWPAQLALPIGAGQVALACLHDGLALRTQPNDGIGWSAGADVDSRTEAIVCALDAAGASAPAADAVEARRRIAVFVEDGSWQAPALKAAARAGIDIDVRALAFPIAAPIDLLSARSGTAARRWLADVDWRAWRLPAGAAAAAIVVALVGLNLHWALLAKESERLHAGIEQRYRDAFPGTQVIVDPMLQMQRQVAKLRARAGQSGPEDFVPLLARFSQALGGQAIDAMASIEFREGRLRVRFQPGFFEARAARDALVRAGQQLGLSVRFDADREPTAAVALLR